MSGKSMNQQKSHEASLAKAKVIGQIERGRGTTESGQPAAFRNVYDDFNHEKHKDFSAYEHKRAAEINEKTRIAHISNRPKPGEMTSHRAYAEKLSQNAALHRAKEADLRANRP